MGGEAGLYRSGENPRCGGGSGAGGTARCPGAQVSPVTDPTLLPGNNQGPESCPYGPLLLRRQVHIQCIPRTAPKSSGLFKILHSVVVYSQSLSPFSWFLNSRLVKKVRLRSRCLHCMTFHPPPTLTWSCFLEGDHGCPGLILGPFWSPLWLCCIFSVTSFQFSPPLPSPPPPPSPHPPPPSAPPSCHKPVTWLTPGNGFPTVSSTYQMKTIFWVRQQC